MQEIIFRIYCKKKVDGLQFPSQHRLTTCCFTCHFLKSSMMNEDVTVAKQQQTRVQDALIWIRRSDIFMEAMMPAKVV